MNSVMTALYQKLLPGSTNLWINNKNELSSHFQFLNLHGHRGFASESAAGEGNLRLDHSTFSILQNGADRLEEQRATQFIAQQMLSESWESCRKLKLKFESAERWRTVLIIVESRKRIVVDGGAAVSSEPHPSTHPLAVSPMLNVGKARQESYQDA